MKAEVADEEDTGEDETVSIQPVEDIDVDIAWLFDEGPAREDEVSVRSKVKMTQPKKNHVKRGDLTRGKCAAVESVTSQSSGAPLPVSDASLDVGVGVEGSASPAPAPQPLLPASSPVESPVVSPVVCGLVTPNVEAAPRPVLSPAAVSSTRVDVHTVMSPAVCGPVPQVVEAAMLSDRALRRVARATSGSATVLPSGGDNSDDLRPVSKRSRQALSLSPPRNAAWADVGEFEDSGSSSSGDGDVCNAVGVPAAPVGRVAAVMGPVVGLSPDLVPVSSPAASASPVAGSPGWEVVAPAKIAREGRGLVPVLTNASVPAASVPLASMSVPSTPLPSAQSSFVTPSPVVSAPAPSPSVIASPCDSARYVAGLCPADSCASVPCGSTVCIKALCAASSRAYRLRGGGHRAGCS
ncbi:uncharacterized protein [Procambarus clarkii]|uniref:uncharacterized protein n=1 Tax=Procambarus clarkii TaxID=6728 RepID=UPI0037437AC3